MTVVNFPAQTPAPSTINIEAEQGVLGAIMNDNAIFERVSGWLRPEHFSEELHARIFAVMETVIAEGRVASPISLKTYLGDHDLGGVTTQQYLIRLAVNAPSVAGAISYTELVIDLFCRREAIRIAADAAEMATYLPTGMRPAELLDSACEQLVALREITASPDADESNTQTVQRLVERGEAHLRGDDTGAMPIGITDLDNRISGGLRAGRLIIMAGRPGAGKTAVELAVAARLAAKGTGVGIFSLEIDRDENVARLMASILARANGPCQPEYSALTTGRMTEQEIEALIEIQKRFACLPIDIDCSAGLTMTQIEARAKRMKLKMERKGQKLGVVFIDYLQLLRMTDRYKGNGVSEIGEAVLHAKNMAKRLGIAVVLLSQLNRGVESREDKRPNMGDLRGSGNIEEHADVVCMLYRPAYYDSKDPKVMSGDDPVAYDLALSRRNDLHAIFDKNRLGPPGETILYIDVARCFVDSKVRGR